jgi:ankyrin repeat protein
LPHDDLQASFETTVYIGGVGDSSWGGEALNAGLIHSIHSGDLAEVKTQLAAGAEVNINNTASHTPLHTAVSMSNDAATTSAIIAALMEAGGDPTKQDKWGRSPLHWACKDGTPASLTALLQGHGGGLHPGLLAGDEDGRNPIHIAAAYGRIDLLKAIILLDLEFDFCAVDSIGSTALHLAAEAGEARTCGYLIERGKIPINAVNAIGNTALHRAARRGQFDVIWLLLAYGADDGPSNESGESARDLAEKAGHFGIGVLLSPTKSF